MSETKSLPTLVKEIVFFYVKYYYNKYNEDNDIQTMNDEHINKFITQYYTEKQQEMKDYIRKSLRKNLGDDYNSIAVENIILELFADEDMGKERIRLEIVDFQNNS